jgi:hypothetical protein
MIPERGYRFSGKIMLKPKLQAASWQRPGRASPDGPPATPAAGKSPNAR